MVDCSKWLFLLGLHTFNHSVLFTMLYMIHPNLVSVSVVIFTNTRGCCPQLLKIESVIDFCIYCYTHALK